MFQNSFALVIVIHMFYIQIMWTLMALQMLGNTKINQ